MEFAPAPFTPEQIRDASAGRRQRVVTVAGESDPVVRITEFVDVTPERTVIRSWLEGHESDAADHTATWDELRDHAKFPADLTEIDRETITTPLGELATLRYTVTAGEATHVFWFATALPGMPVRYQTVQGDEVVSTTTIVADTAVAAP